MGKLIILQEGFFDELAILDIYFEAHVTDIGGHHREKATHQS